jgi:competence protein ComEA
MFFVNPPVVNAPKVIDRPRPTWSPAAQVAVALILTTCLAALGWTAYEHHQRAAAAPIGNDYVIDLNRADHAELLQLPGVGESLAGRIEAYRDKHGPFHTVEELRSVRGIGPVTLARLSPYVSTSKSSPEAIKGDDGKASTKAHRPKEENAVEDQDQSDRP